MAGIMVPKSKAETPIGGGDRLFPAGTWIGKIDQTYVQDFPEWVTEKQGYGSKEGEVVSVQIGSARPLGEGQEDAGNQKFFVKFVTRDGEIEVSAGPDIPGGSWQMQRSAAQLTNLALALGQTEEVQMEGETYVVTSDSFLDDLRSGALNNAEVGFTTFHRAWKSGTKSGTSVELKEFFTAV